jgi:putative cardiolipin synthase
MKSKLKLCLFVLAVVLLYEILGACLPFIHTKKVKKSYADQVHTEEFYKTSGGSDWAGIAETNGEALRVRLSMFEEAQESIVISTFDIRKGKSTSDIFASLLAAADRGVKVQILVDGLYGMIHMDGQEIFQAAGSHPNLEIRYYNKPNLLKPWTINGRMHDKYVLIDNRLLLMGGRNMFDYFIGDYPEKNKGFDREVLLYHQEKEGEAPSSNVILTVREYFGRIWNQGCTRTVFESKSSEDPEIAKELKRLSQRYQKLEKPVRDVDWKAELVPVDHAVFVTNPTNIGPKEPWVWYTMDQLMKDADHRVVIQTPYTVFSHDMYQGMSELAKKVGQADLLINSTAVGDNFMASSDYTHNKKKVLDTDVSVYEYFGDYSCHGKSILIDDDLSVVGSYNFDMRSTYVDTETMLVIHGEEFNSLLEEKMEAIRADSLKVTGTDTYAEKEGVDKKELSKEKKCLFWFTSKLIQLVRYLA